MDPAAGAIIGVQVAILVGMAMVGGWMALKNAPPGEYNAKFWWNVARTVVVFLPMALAWFGLFCGMFLQAIDLIIPVLVGVMAVAVNIAIDKGVTTGIIGGIWSRITSVFLWLGRLMGMVKQVPA
jgi:hypothetical protein